MTRSILMKILAVNLIILACVIQIAIFQHLNNNKISLAESDFFKVYHHAYQSGEVSAKSNQYYLHRSNWKQDSLHLKSFINSIKN